MSAPLRIAITGASGLVGSALVERLRTEGHTPIPLVRRAPASGEVRWDPAGNWDAAPLEGIDAVVHLAGESIADGRWTAARKAAIRRSRVEGTRSLVEAGGRLTRPPRVLLSASAMGIYGDRGDTLLPESAPAGTDFLGALATEWESEAASARRHGSRVVQLRFGLVLSPAGGALGKMLLPFRLGLGGPLGSGRQWMSWIAIDDLVTLILTAIRDPRYEGPINAVTAEPVTNAAFTRALGRVLRRPTFLPVPAFALRLLFGELAEGALLASQRVVPTRLQTLGFEWRYPELEGALRHLLGR